MGGKPRITWGFRPPWAGDPALAEDRCGSAAQGMDAAVRTDCGRSALRSSALSQCHERKIRSPGRRRRACRGARAAGCKRCPGAHDTLPAWSLFEPWLSLQIRIVDPIDDFSTGSELWEDSMPRPFRSPSLLCALSTIVTSRCRRVTIRSNLMRLTPDV